MYDQIVLTFVGATLSLDTTAAQYRNYVTAVPLKQG